jgi:hypothetical protein
MDHSCYVVMKTPYDLPPRLGGPSVFYFNSWQHTRPKTPPLNLLVDRGPKHYWTGRCLAGLFLEPHLSGHNAYLVFSVDLSGDLKETNHQKRLAQLEPMIPTNPWIVHWLGTCASVAAYHPFQGLGRIQAALNKEHMAKLFEVVGNPEEEGSWLASRLLPRRVGASVRSLSPTIFQCWIRL